MNKLTGQGRKEQIINTALDFFSGKGFYGTTTLEIAKKAGISEALLYKHFRNKEELFNEVLKYETANKKKNVLLLPAKHRETNLFRTIAFDLIKTFGGETKIWRILLFASLEQDKVNESFSLFEKNVSATEEIIALKIKERIFRKDLDPKKTALSFNWLILGLIQRSILFKREALEEQVDEFVSVFVEGLRNRQ